MSKRSHRAQRLTKQRNALLLACQIALDRLRDNRDPETLGVWDPDADVEEELENAIALSGRK